MSASRLIKRRIKSAKNISQITKAMEMVSASKMRRAQEQALASRPYAQKLYETLRMVATHTNSSSHPLLQINKAGKALVLLISSDRGLVGSLNTNLFKATEEALQNLPQAEFVAVGRKARDFVVKTGRSLYGEFTGLPDKLRFEDALPIAELVMNAFLSGGYQSVQLVHMQFISTLTQKAVVEQLLPISHTEIQELAAAQPSAEYTFEPNAKDILDTLLPYFIEITIYQDLLDAKASEHSARMVSMKNASDNAKDVVKELTLSYNKSRQASITSELLDISTAALSVA